MIGMMERWWVNGEDEGEVCIKVRGGMYDTSRA